VIKPSLKACPKISFSGQMCGESPSVIPPILRGWHDARLSTGWLQEPVAVAPALRSPQLAEDTIEFHADRGVVPDVLDQPPPRAKFIAQIAQMDMMLYAECTPCRAPSSR
jgi:hypothetical protein